MTALWTLNPTVTWIANQVVCAREFLVREKAGFGSTAWVRGGGSVDKGPLTNGTSVGVVVVVSEGGEEIQEIYAGPPPCVIIF